MSVSSSRIMSNHINYDMICQSGWLYQMGSCKIISIMRLCFIQVRSDHYHSHWNYDPLCQKSGFWADIGVNVGIFYPNPTVLWIFSWGYLATVSINTIPQHTLWFNFNIKIFFTTISYTALSSHFIPLSNIVSNSAETLNVVSSWRISIETI